MSAVLEGRELTKSFWVRRGRGPLGRKVQVHAVESVSVALEAGRAHWLPAQIHAGENTGTTATHVLFVELKDAGPAASPASPVIGPS